MACKRVVKASLCSRLLLALPLLAGAPLLAVMAPGNDWHLLGSAGFSAGVIYTPSFAIAPDGAPYMAVSDSSVSLKASVYRYDGSAWQLVGPAGLTPDVALYTSLAIDSSGTPYLAFYDEAAATKISVMKFDGTNWSYVGSAGFGGDHVSDTSLGFDNSGQPWVSYITNSTLRVARWDGTAWQDVGSLGQSANGTALAFDSAGVPHVAFIDSNAMEAISVLKYDGANWVSVGGAAVGGVTNVLAVTLAVGQDDDLYLAALNGNAIAFRFDGTSWQQLGSAITNIYAAAFTLDEFDRPFTVVSDAGSSFRLTGYAFDGSNWNVLGTPAFTPDAAILPVMDAAGGKIYVGYRDYYNGLKASVHEIILNIPPTVLTTAISGIQATSASGGGTVASDGGDAVTARGVCWSVNANPTVAGSHTNDGAGTGAFSSAITGLTANTTYHVRAYATNTQGTSYGADVSFSTSAIPASVTTAAVTGITSAAASGGGTVTAGSNPVTARGLCWNTTGSPSTADSMVAAGSGGGSFNAALSGLTRATKYYVRAYATDALGTVYGAEVNFTTLAVAPVVQTASAASSVAATTAVVSGEVTDDGGSPITGRGVCWSTSGTPTIDNESVAAESAGTGAFSVTLSGLSAATKYVARAYATNAIGTSYGEALEITTAAESAPAPTPTPTPSPVAPDLRIEAQSLATGAVLVGQVLPFSLTISNVGGELVSQVRVTFPVPSGTEYVDCYLVESPAAQSIALEADVVDGVVTVALPDLAAGGSLRLIVNLRATAKGSVSLNAGVKAGGAEEAVAQVAGEQVTADVVDEVIRIVGPGPLCGWFGLAPAALLLISLPVARRRFRR